MPPRINVFCWATFIVALGSAVTVMPITPPCESSGLTHLSLSSCRNVMCFNSEIYFLRPYAAIAVDEFNCALIFTSSFRELEIGQL